MTTPVRPPPVRVVGGTGGITANRAELEHLSRRLVDDGEDAARAAATVSGIRDDVGTPFFGGGFGAAGRWDAAGLLRARALLDDAERRLHSSGDQLQRLGHKVSWAAQGYPWGSSVLDAGILAPVERLLGLAGAGITPTGPLITGSSAAPDDPRPEQLDMAATLFGLTALTAAGAPATDGLGVAIPTGPATPVAAPRRLTDLVDGLAETNRHGGAGGIDVRILVAADGTRRAVVDITGTRTWRAGGRNPADLTTNAMAVTGRSGAYTHGVFAALRRAGVRTEEPVLLVGHSQGGMVAVTAARDAARTGEFRVTHVVTAGSPIAGVSRDLPASVRVLAMENTRDAVPSLDARPNPDRVNVTTVRGTLAHGSVGADHDIDASYRPLAEAAQRQGGRSVRDFLDSARGFFDADTAERQPYRVERR